MLRSTASKLAWLGRTASMVFGLALILALVFGVATTALAGTGVGAVFNLGKTNTVNAISKLVGTTTSSMLMVDNNGAGTALDLRVGSSSTPASEKAVAPMKVNSQAQVANLKAQFAGQADNAAQADHATSADSATSATSAGDANALDDQDSTAFLGKSEKAADSDKLDGQDSSAFAAANHNHDSSYIQQSPASPENASIYIDGTMRTSGMLRTGSETGTWEGPEVGMPWYDGLVIRRAVSADHMTGAVVARTDELRLERDGTFGGLRLAWNAGARPESTIACTGITYSGTPVGKYFQISGAGPAAVFTDSQNVVYYSCSFGHSAYVAQVAMQRRDSDYSWVGTITSNFNQ